METITTSFSKSCTLKPVLKRSHFQRKRFTPRQFSENPRNRILPMIDPALKQSTSSIKYIIFFFLSTVVFVLCGVSLTHLWCVESLAQSPVCPTAACIQSKEAVERAIAQSLDHFSQSHLTNHPQNKIAVTWFSSLPAI